MLIDSSTCFRHCKHETLPQSMYSWVKLTICLSLISKYAKVYCLIGLIDSCKERKTEKYWVYNPKGIEKVLQLNTHFYYYHSYWYYLQIISLWKPILIGDCCDLCCLLKLLKIVLRYLSKVTRNTMNVYQEIVYWIKTLLLNQLP